MLGFSGTWQGRNLLETVREYVLAAPFAAVLTTPRDTKTLSAPNSSARNCQSHAFRGVLDGFLCFGRCLYGVQAFKRVRDRITNEAMSVLNGID